MEQDVKTLCVDLVFHFHILVHRNLLDLRELAVMIREILHRIVRGLHFILSDLNALKLDNLIIQIEVLLLQQINLDVLLSELRVLRRNDLHEFVQGIGLVSLTILWQFQVSEFDEGIMD